MMLHHPFRPRPPVPYRDSVDALESQPGQHSTRLRPRESWALRGWALWSLPRRAVLYVLIVDAAALAVLAASVLPPVSWADVQTGAFIGAAMLAHLYLARVDEQLHRTRRRSPHIDLGWIWLFPSAVLLPPLLALALVLLYTQRWWLFSHMDFRPLHRRVFNTAVWVLATAAAGAVVGVSGRREHLASDPGGWADLAVMLLAAAVAFGLNLALVAAVLALATGARRRHLFAAAGENLIEVSTLLLGVCVVMAIASWPPFVALIVLPAVVLHRTVRIPHLEVVARTDDKTGVLNALAFHQQARGELTHARRVAGSMAVFMIDMDGFKQINDEYGHLTGDSVLQRVARVLAAEVRRTDTVGRVGGDEFAVVLPAIDVPEALAVAERIRAQIRQLSVPVAGGLSTSIGVAVYPHAGADTVEGMLAAADTALYQAKRGGRDRICLAGQQRAATYLPSTGRDAA